MEYFARGWAAGAFTAGAAGAAPRAGTLPSATILAQVAASSLPVTGTPFLACHVLNAARVSGPNWPSASTPITFCASATSAPLLPWTSTAYTLEGVVGLAVGLGAAGAGPASIVVTALPVHHEVRL